MDQILEGKNSTWEIKRSVFKEWLNSNNKEFFIGFSLEPSVKLLIFLALLENKEHLTYANFANIFKEKDVISGSIPQTTLRTSVLSLGKTLDKTQNYYELKSHRGSFRLVKREINKVNNTHTPSVLTLENSINKAQNIAHELVEKARLPFNALYFLENSARWWEIFSHSEAQIRIQYEVDSWTKLGIKERMFVNDNSVISIVGLATGEGLAEIELIKRILSENKETIIHYLAIDLSNRLLRDHISLLSETLHSEIGAGRLICVGVLGDIFSEFKQAISKARLELEKNLIINTANEFLPDSSSLLVTYLGNCLGNYYPDQETEIFTLIYSTFRNRHIEILVGVSVMRGTPDEYKRNWDSFLLETPKHLLETYKCLISSREENNTSLPEFSLPQSGESERCPSVIPENYAARHQIEGHIYRFYYKLEYDLFLNSNMMNGTSSLPKGTLILLYNIVKYNMDSLVKGIAKLGAFCIKYDPNYHKTVDTPNGKREYAVFSAYINQ